MGLVRPRCLALTALALLLVATNLRATTIQLKNGQTMDGVTIVSRGPDWVNVQNAYGVVRVAVDDIRTIDGVAPVPPKPLIPESTVTAEAEAIAETNAAPVAAYQHRWAMDWFLLGLVVLSAAWIGGLLWVQKDVESIYEGHAKPIKLRNTLVLLLPGLGFVIYLIARQRVGQMREHLATEADEVLAATGRELPKRKWRFLFKPRERVVTPVRTKEEALMLEFLDEDGQPITIKKSLPGMSGIGSARDLLAEAIVERASDVHLEPREKGWRVRFRIDGVMQERVHLAKTDTVRMLSALKTLAGIDVAEKRKAQDGRFGVRTTRGQVDLRVATTSSIHGEKLVLRLLDRKTGLLGLTELGMAAPMLALFNRVIHSHNGMILVTGPTGSGKTTTLYAALNQLDTKKLNIMTIEDPVEYELDGATQIPVNPRAGVTYASGLRSILRQDPDVIFVGEMRDEEAAKIAIRSALTGHLVFSSLHTNNAISTIVRLLEIGVEKYQISSSLLMVVAQRLVRVLCSACRERYTPPPGTGQEVGLVLPPDAIVYRARGCEHCGDSGYLGRTAIFELLVMDEELRGMLNESFNEQQLWAAAKRKGSRPLREDGLEKILAGVTTIDEVLQAQ